MKIFECSRDQTLQRSYNNQEYLPHLQNYKRFIQAEENIPLCSIILRNFYICDTQKSERNIIFWVAANPIVFYFPYTSLDPQEVKLQVGGSHTDNQVYNARNTWHLDFSHNTTKESIVKTMLSGEKGWQWQKQDANCCFHGNDCGNVQFSPSCGEGSAPLGRAQTQCPCSDTEPTPLHMRTVRLKCPADSNAGIFSGYA